MVQRSCDVNTNFSFFDAPLPRTSDIVFAIDPAMVGRSLPRPSRPIPQTYKNSIQNDQNNLILNNNSYIENLERQLSLIC